MRSQNRIAVIGAGLSGLMCARTLTEAGHLVQVFDKGRAVGGRASTRRTPDGLAFDHGAQYMTVRDPRTEPHLREWLGQGVVAEWGGDIVTLEQGRVTRRSDSQTRYVGVPGMNALCKDLASGCDVRLETRVAPLTRQDTTWRLSDSQGQHLGEFDAAVVSAPPAQLVELIGDASPLAERVRQVRMSGCWTVMAAFAGRVPAPFDGAFIQKSKLGWAARNSGKPGRPDGPECWVINGLPEWSDEHLEAEPGWVVGELLAEFWRVTELGEVPAAYVDAHRWRYSIPPEPLKEEALLDVEARLVACGDWCCGARVEGALVSGMAAAERVLHAVSHNE